METLDIWFEMMHRERKKWLIFKHCTIFRNPSADILCIFLDKTVILRSFLTAQKSRKKPFFRGEKGTGKGIESHICDRIGEKHVQLLT